MSIDIMLLMLSLFLLVLSVVSLIQYVNMIESRKLPKRPSFKKRNTRLIILCRRYSSDRVSGVVE